MLSYAAALAELAYAFNDAGFVPAGVTTASAPRLDVYRNNVRLNRINALRATFAQVAELVGAEFFNGMARAYVRATPATSANLHDDGAQLAAFIATFAPARSVPYLADVARVDWALHRAWHAPDCAPFAVAQLQTLTPEQFAQQRVRFAPAVALVASPAWPIADLLAMHQGGALADPDAGGQAVLIWRAGTQVQHRALGPAHAVAVRSLQHGAPLHAVLPALQADTALLPLLFTDGLISALEAHHACAPL
ncbi:HvfC/BufC N-terminal domain-containing protein [Amantichitinum ursilacus]|uniref:Putative DNA-binding domain-containing protein n=1 Tax=Amantichitinum ursilacus TaxID=857265 RepID=A0A0N0XGZ5_9NEIS|nr:DNA-binding domain-containing protein [Amantichitinum ursilacus]KPC50413.1 hypothetical protein WG78_17435 [Amantichitinum ursilacus]